MIWKRYQNELIVGVALVLMLAVYLYKNSQVKQLDSTKIEVAQSVEEIGEIIALKQQWGDPKLKQRVEKVKQGLQSGKIKSFTVKGKKLTASLQGLSSKEMNSVITKLENIAIQIVKLSVQHKDGTYQMEIKCKW